MPWKSTVKWGTIGRNPPVADFGRVTTGMADWSISSDWFVTRTACYVFQNGWEFSLIQKNNVNFLHGDTFRNGLLVGVKIPF